MTVRSISSPCLQADAVHLLSDLIHARLGLYYDAAHQDILKDKLAPLLAEHDIDSYLDYYYLLKYDAQAQEEWLRLQTALAVRETYFWREFGQIRLTAEVLAPGLLGDRPGRPVRVWHAACASGEEPYSMVMALQEAGCYDRGDIQVTATDFDIAALNLAREGLYRERSFRALTEDLRQRYFTPQPNGMRQLNAAIRDRVQFEYLNLMDENAMRGMRDFDIIFCRNVFLYFSTAATAAVAHRLYESLRAPGYLLVGVSESLIQMPVPLQLRDMHDTFVYVKDPCSGR